MPCYIPFDALCKEGTKTTPVSEGRAMVFHFNISKKNKLLFKGDINKIIINLKEHDLN